MNRFVTLALRIGVVGTILLVLSMAIPSWLANENDEFGKMMLINLFYQVECVNQRCMLDDRFYDKDSIPLKDKEWRFDPSVVPALILICCILSCIALLIIECLDLKCCYRRVSNRPAVAAATVLLAIGVILGTIGFFIACAVADQYYAHDEIEGPIDFPWALLIAFIALILLWISAIMFFIVVWKWYKHGKTFDRKRVMFMDKQKSRRYQDDVVIYSEKYHKNGSPGYTRRSRYGSSYNEQYHRSKSLPDMDSLQSHSPKILRDTVVRSDYGHAVSDYGVARHTIYSYDNPQLYRSYSDPHILGSIEHTDSTRTFSLEEPVAPLYYKRRLSLSEPDLARQTIVEGGLLGASTKSSYEAYVI